MQLFFSATKEKKQSFLQARKPCFFADEFEAAISTNERDDRADCASVLSAFQDYEALACRNRRSVPCLL
ncbi:hypothetical protein NBRC111894_288 [Sporolactobacillus inulinus]|uniref:Uncharacterized protein n=1 Tax=Sporolactobacillus inulinus TaxID=2078 RepID=A0A4Y1Z6W6_9BACL|nr:hypothetical protein NBRC111894_288 [Sporolactobacillus inulinus]